MITLFEFELFDQLTAFWNTTIANIGKANDYIPLIFGQLPPTGTTSMNQAAVAKIFQQLSTAPDNDRLRILMQYPTIRAHIPCITIEVGEEREDEAVGRFVEWQQDETTGQWYYNQGSSFVRRYSIGVYTPNPDTTSLLYAFVKYAILALNSKLQLTASSILSGRSLLIDPRFLQEGEEIFVRYLDITAEGSIDSAELTYDQVKDVGIDLTTLKIPIEADISL